jgi:hypothetical protein
MIDCESHSGSVGIDWYRLYSLYPKISIRINQYLLLFTIEVFVGTEELSSVTETERVICEMSTKAEERVEHPTYSYNEAKSDGSTPSVRASIRMYQF